MSNPATEKVKRSFDFSKFDNIDISDDEDTFHPNIEKNFNVRINQTVRRQQTHIQFASRLGLFVFLYCNIGVLPAAWAKNSVLIWNK